MTAMVVGGDAQLRCAGLSTIVFRRRYPGAWDQFFLNTREPLKPT
jgi:hypothetical protein